MNRDLVELIARTCHEANRAIQATFADPAPSPPWDEAPDWQRESAIHGVELVATGEHDPAAMHLSWCKEKRAQGWKKGAVKDAEKRTHPCLVAYDDLPPDQLVKDSVFAAIASTLIGRLRHVGYYSGLTAQPVSSVRHFPTDPAVLLLG